MIVYDILNYKVIYRIQCFKRLILIFTIFWIVFLLCTMLWTTFDWKQCFRLYYIWLWETCFWLNLIVCTMFGTVWYLIPWIWCDLFVFLNFDIDRFVYNSFVDVWACSIGFSGWYRDPGEDHHWSTDGVPRAVLEVGAPGSLTPKSEGEGVLLTLTIAINDHSC